VRHGSNQSVIEFYGEYYSNTDLQAFMALSGLANVSLPQVGPLYSSCALPESSHRFRR